MQFKVCVNFIIVIEFLQFFFNADSNNILLHTTSSSIYFCKFQLHMWASFSDPCVSHELWLFISSVVVSY